MVLRRNSAERNPAERNPAERNPAELPQGMVGHPDVLNRLLETFRSATYRPPRLPAAATELLELTRQPKVAVDRIVRLLENEQLLAAEVLRLAQSAAYSGKTAVDSLGEAIVRLGVRRTSDLFLESVMNLRVFRCREYQSQMDVLRRHSAAVAHTARLISRETALYDEHAFLCGLLHDVGIAAALIAFSENAAPAYDFVWPAIERAHEECGAILCRLWKLPSSVELAVGHHHHYMLAGTPHPTAVAVCLADGVVASLGLGFEQAAEGAGLALAATHLELGPKEMERVRTRVRHLLESLR